MAFKFSKQKDTVRLKCEAVIPNDRGGEVKHAFFADFKVPTPAERSTMRDRVRHEDAEVAQFLPDWLAGWAQIYDEADEPLEFNDDNVERVLGDMYLADAMAIAWSDYLYNRGAVRRKN